MTPVQVVVWLLGIAVLWVVAWVRGARMGMGDVVFFVGALVIIAVVVGLVFR